jgi:hypothetical protein
MRLEDSLSALLQIRSQLVRGLRMDSQSAPMRYGDSTQLTGGAEVLGFQEHTCPELGALQSLAELRGAGYADASEGHIMLAP